MLIALSISLICLIIPLTVLIIWSFPGKPKPFIDEKGKPIPGSISEKIYIDINGVKQGLFIKGMDKNNPVLLFLHGGMPDYFLTERYPTGLEKYFIAAWWEQRGSGISFKPGISPKSITADQLLSDTLEITNYLRRRFEKEKIYLMGHSGGTFIGIQSAAKNPELYYAYIGVGQMSNQLKSEILAYEYMINRLNESGNKKLAKKLESAPVTISGGTPGEYLSLRDEAMHSLGIGTTHKMKSVIHGIFIESLKNRDYTLSEKINLWRGKASTGVSPLWDEMLATDLSGRVKEIIIPVYFFEGIYDYTCSYVLAKDYFKKLKAPVKGFYTFENSAHSPIFEEPGKIEKILEIDILNGSNNLADKQ